jgi:hypothetical protein
VQFDPKKRQSKKLGSFLFLIKKPFFNILVVLDRSYYFLGHFIYRFFTMVKNRNAGIPECREKVSPASLVLPLVCLGSPASAF